ncbi:HNH endonuclease [Vibrio chagasii]|uniref:HNH endonuclease n=1 Tax=Vibrio chagasii TaxID=170679 RepID=UPI0038CE0A9E
MRRNRNISNIINGGPALDLVSTVERFVYRTPLDDNEAAHFEELNEYLLEYAFASKDISESTALHKVLYDLAYIEFYLYLYDDLDWVSDYTDFSQYAIQMFKHMNIAVPREFYRKSEDGIIEARDLHRSLFLSGLQFFVDSAFAHLWFRKAFLFDFNSRLAEKISPLTKQQCPVLEKDGQLPRAQHFNKWIRDLILNREGGLCHYCNTPVAIPSMPNQTYDIDHMFPIARGGTNDPTNLVLSCPKCNNKKRARVQSIPDTFAWPTRPNKRL